MAGTVYMIDEILPQNDELRVKKTAGTGECRRMYFMQISIYQDLDGLPPPPPLLSEPPLFERPLPCERLPPPPLLSLLSTLLSTGAC